MERDPEPLRHVANLQELDRVELMTLVDNTIDVLLPSTATVRRAPHDAILGGPKSRLRAEHGFSTLVTVVKDGSRHSLLFDAGLTRDGLVTKHGDPGGPAFGPPRRRPEPRPR